MSTSTMTLKKDIHEFIETRFHPCLMAKSVLMKKDLVINDYEFFNNSCEMLLGDLKDFLVSTHRRSAHEYQSFIAVFSKETFYSEIEFEKNFWEYLNQLSSLDPEPWCPNVSADVHSKDFAFSLLGSAFYLIGMHPRSSRRARQFKHTAIVFNLHDQFEHLRSMGVYTNVRNKIRSRDKKLQGSINPMLKDFGTDSQAKQYSGRAVDDDWVCPFSK